MDFLLRLLTRPGLPLAWRVLRVCCELGVVVGRHWTLTGYRDPRPWLERWHGSDDSTELAHFLACYHRLEQAAPLLLRLVETPGSARLRAWAAYALAWLPRSADVSIETLLHRVARDPSASVRASSLLTVGALSLARPAAERAALSA